MRRLVVIVAMLAAACGSADGAGPPTTSITSATPRPAAEPTTAATAPTTTSTSIVVTTTVAVTTASTSTTAEPTTTTTEAPPQTPLTAASEPTTSATPRPAPTEATRNDPPAAPFSFAASPITAALAARMTPTSWRPGCPVGLEQLRHLTLTYWGFDGQPHQGELVVHADVVGDMEAVFAALYTSSYPIRRMELVDNYGGDDDASIEADNTSAFNCRPVAGTNRWSNHAYGKAIDINPIENPYVSAGQTSHSASVPFLDRSNVRPGMIVEGDAVTRAFDARGWDWGGRWTAPIDYQHFSATGG